jgi:hypothetical protein
VASCFLLQETAFAVPGAGLGAGPASAPAPASSAALPLSRLIQDPAQIPIPFDAVTLQEVHAGTSGKLIVHIQDAHANLSGQQALAKAVEHFVAKHGISVVLVEGANRDVTLDEVRKLAPLKEWSVIARRFLYEGIISGEEYLNLTTEHPMRLRGIEYQDLYDEAVKTYAALVDRRKDILHYLYQAKVSLDRLKGRMYPAELLEYEKQKGTDDPGSGVGFADALKGLFALLPKAGLDLSEYPALRGLKETMDREGTLDFDAANREQVRILGRLDPEEARAFTEASRRLRFSQVSQYRLTHQLLDQASGRGLDAASFPELKKYAEYLERFLDLKMEQVMIEREKLEDRVFESVLPTDDARKVRAIDRFLGLLGNAYKLQMSSHEFGMHELNEKDFPTESWLAFMNRQLVDLGFFESMVPTQEHLEEAHADFKKFYRLVSDRDGAFVENTQKIMAEEKTDAAILIAGGYHTDHLTRLLRERGDSYIVLTPLVTDATDHEKYEKILLQHLKDQERRLAASSARRQGGPASDTGLGRAENVAATKIPRGIRSVSWTLSGGRMSRSVQEFTDAHVSGGVEGARMSLKVLEILGTLFNRPANRRASSASSQEEIASAAAAAARLQAETEARTSIRIHPSIPEDLAERMKGVWVNEDPADRQISVQNFNTAFERLTEAHGAQEVLNALDAHPEESARMMALLRPVELDNLLRSMGRTGEAGLRRAVDDLGAEVIADASVSEDARAFLAGLGVDFAPMNADLEDPKARRFKLRVGGLADGAPRQDDTAVLYGNVLSEAAGSKNPVWAAMVAMTVYDSLIDIEARHIASINDTPMVLTHVTDYPPSDGWIRTTMTANHGASSRYSVHFAVDAIVASHTFGNFDHASYTTLHSFRDLLRANPGRFVGGQPSDVFFVGDVRLPDSSVTLEGRSKNEIKRYFDRTGTTLKEVNSDDWNYYDGLNSIFFNTLSSRGYHIRRHEGSWTRAFEAGYGYIKHPMRELFRAKAAELGGSGPVGTREIMEAIWADKFEPHVPKTGRRYAWIQAEVTSLSQELAAITVLRGLPAAAGVKEIEAFRALLLTGAKTEAAASAVGDQLAGMNIDPQEWDAIAEWMVRLHDEVRADIRNAAEQILRSNPLPERSQWPAFLEGLRKAASTEARTGSVEPDGAIAGILSDVEHLSESSHEPRVLLEAIEAALEAIDRERSEWVVSARGQLKAHQAERGYEDRMLSAVIRQRIELEYGLGAGVLDSVMREAFGDEDWENYRDAYLRRVQDPDALRYRTTPRDRYDEAIDVYVELYGYFDQLEAQGLRVGKGHFGKALYGWPKNLLTALQQDMGFSSGSDRRSMSGARMASGLRVAQLRKFLVDQYQQLRRNISAAEPVLPEYATTYVAFLTPGDEGNRVSGRIINDGRVTSMIADGWVLRIPLDLNNSQEHSVSLRVSIGPAAGDPRMSEDFFNALDKLTWTHVNPDTGSSGLSYKYPFKPSGWSTRVDSMVFYLNSDRPEFVLKVASEISELAAGYGYLREEMPVNSGEEVADGVFMDKNPDEKSAAELIDRARLIDPDFAEAAHSWLSRAFAFRSSSGQFEVLRTLVERLESGQISLPVRDAADARGLSGARLSEVMIGAERVAPYTELTEELELRIGEASASALNSLFFDEESAAPIVLEKRFWISESGQVWLEYTADHRDRARNSLEVYRAALSEGFENLAEVVEPEKDRILTRLAQSYSGEELAERQAGLAELLVYMVRFGDDDHQVFEASQYERWAKSGLDKKVLFNVYRKALSDTPLAESQHRYLVIDPEHGRVGGPAASDWEGIRAGMAKKFNKISVDEAAVRAAVDRLTLSDADKEVLRVRVEEVLKDINQRASAGTRMAVSGEGARMAKEARDNAVPAWLEGYRRPAAVAALAPNLATQMSDALQWLSVLGKGKPGVFGQISEADYQDVRSRPEQMALLGLSLVGSEPVQARKGAVRDYVFFDAQKMLETLTAILSDREVSQRIFGEVLSARVQGITDVEAVRQLMDDAVNARGIQGRARDALIGLAIGYPVPSVEYFQSRSPDDVTPTQNIAQYLQSRSHTKEQVDWLMARDIRSRSIQMGIANAVMGEFFFAAAPNEDPESIRQTLAGWRRGLAEAMPMALQGQVKDEQIAELVRMARSEYPAGARMAFAAGPWKVGSISTSEEIMRAMREREGIVLEQLDRMGADAETAEIAVGLLDVTRGIYEQQGLAASPNYHNHFHNLLVVHSALILSDTGRAANLSKREGPDRQKQLLLTFVAALLHDFRIEAAPAEGGKYTPADVTNSLTQIRRILGLREDPSLVRSGFGLDRAPKGRFGATFFESGYEDLRARMGELLRRSADRFGGPEKFMRSLQPIIRATDFPSDKPPVTAVQATEQKWLSVSRRAIEQSVSPVPDANNRARETMSRLRKKARASITGLRRSPFVMRKGIGHRIRQTSQRLGRVLGIQEAYLKELMRVPAEEKAWIHAQAQALTAADQLSDDLLLDPKAVEDVVKALVLEGVVASADGTFPFFMASQFLKEDVLDVVSGLPVEVRQNFAAVIEHFYAISKASPKPFIAGHASVVKYDSDAFERGTRQWVRVQLGLEAKPVRSVRPSDSAYPLLRESLLVSGSVSVFSIDDQQYSIVLNRTPEGRVFRTMHAFGDAYVHGFNPNRVAAMNAPQGSIDLLSVSTGTGSRIVSPSLGEVLALGRPELAGLERSELRRMAQLARGVSEKRSVVIGLPAELHAALGEEALGRFSQKLREQNPGETLNVVFTSYLSGGQDAVRSAHPGADVILFSPSEPLSAQTAPLFLGSGLLGYESDPSGTGKYPNMARAIVFAVTLALEKHPSDLQDRSAVRNLFGSPASGRALEAMKLLERTEQISLVVNHSIPAELKGPELEAAFLSILETSWSA